MQGKPIHKKYLVVLLFVLSFLIYGRTINYGFLWDDQRSHLDAHKELMNGDIQSLWSKPYDGMYIPVSYTTWYALKTIAWNDAVKQLSPKPFHFANVLTHSLNCVLLFFILFLLLKNPYASFVGSLLFAFHPMQVESVAWISEFRGLYSCFFSFASIYLLLKHISMAPVSKLKDLLFSRSFAYSTLLFIFALLAKPSAIVLPIIMLLLIWCFYSLSFRTALKAMALWLLLVIPIAFLTSSSQTNELMNFIVPLPSRIFVFCYSAWFYITKITMPLKLVPSYGITPQVILEDSWLYIYAAIIIGMSIILFSKRESLRYFFTGYYIVLVSILPVSGLVSFYFQRYSNVADRYVYFALFGLALVFAYLWNATKEKKYVRYILSLFLICCVTLTIKQTPVWKNEFSLWDHSMKNYPEQYMASYNRAVLFGKQGKLEEAIADYTIALKFNKKDKNSYVNRANAFAQKNKYNDALSDYSEAIKLDEKDGSIYYNRALTNYNIGNYSACPADINKALQLKFPVDPEFMKAVRSALKQPPL